MGRVVVYNVFFAERKTQGETPTDEGTHMETPQLIDIEQVANGWIKKYILSYRLPGGTPYTYEAVSRKGLDAFRSSLEHGAGGRADAICIVPLIASSAAEHREESVLVIREFRYPLNNWCIALPAGLVESDEDLSECADRELREETGYCIVPGTEARPLPQPGFSSTGLTDETVQIVFVQAERAADAQPEIGELIEVFELPLTQIRAFLDTNTTPIGTRAQMVLEMLAR